MNRPATEIMQEVIFSAVIDAVSALKTASKGVPNTLLRDLGAIHANTSFADLPPELRASIADSVRAAFTRLLKEGYTVGTGQPAPMRGPPPGREGTGPGPRRPRPTGGREGDGRGPPPGGGRPRGGKPPGRKPPGR